MPKGRLTQRVRQDGTHGESKTNKFMSGIFAHCSKLQLLLQDPQHRVGPMFAVRIAMSSLRKQQLNIRLFHWVILSCVILSEVAARFCRFGHGVGPILTVWAAIPASRG